MKVSRSLLMLTFLGASSACVDHPQMDGRDPHAEPAPPRAAAVTGTRVSLPPVVDAEVAETSGYVRQLEKRRAVRAERFEALAATKARAFEQIAVEGTLMREAMQGFRSSGDSSPLADKDASGGPDALAAR